MTLCWDMIVLDDFEQGGIYKYNDQGILDLYIPYDRITGFECYGNYICFLTRGNENYFINFYNETDHENAIAHLCEMDLFYNESPYLYHNGEFDLSFGDKLLIGNRYIYKINKRGYCVETIYVGDIEEVTDYYDFTKSYYIRIKEYNDVGRSWRTYRGDKINSYGSTKYFNMLTQESLERALNIFQKVLEERDKR